MCHSQGGDNMSNINKVKRIVENSPNGVITASQLTKSGMHLGYLHEFVKNGELYRFSRGLYVKNDAWEDDFYLLQQKYSRGIYSHDTALYLLGYSDRTIRENYDFGIIEIQSPSGNLIRVYELERTLCDILRGDGSDIQIVNSAMKRYAASKNKNIHKLMKYAEQLHVKTKILRYMEVLL